MSRTTLKLPAKSTRPNEPTDIRLPARKPVRGGAKLANKSLAQRADVLAAKAAREAGEAAKITRREERPRVVKPEHEVKASPRAPRVEREAGERSVKPAAKVYPPRGVARSTGARALPPVRQSSENAERLPSVTPPPLPPSEETKPESAPPRRPLNEQPRLSKQIVAMTQCSRREADEWIENGWVCVDGVVVCTLGARVHPKAKIEIKAAASTHEMEIVTILLNKPLDDDGAAQREEGGELVRLLRAENRWPEDDSPLTFKATHLRGLALAGKLDAESTGMLVFTQEGSVARRIAGDSTRLEKEYLVRVEGELSEENLKKLQFGLSLDDVKLKQAQVSWQSEGQLRFVLHEKKERQLQRMCELVGLSVVSIKRIRIGSVSLGKLPLGQWRYLRANERF